MTNEKAMEIWSDTLLECLGCYDDPFGHRPCDYGCPCDKCSADWVQNVYRRKLEMEERMNGKLNCATWQFMKSKQKVRMRL